MIGTGRHRTMDEMGASIESSGTEIITIAIGRLNLDDPNEKSILDYFDWQKYTILPNTAGCFTSDDALRTLRLAREIGGWKLVKLEVLGDKKSLLPDIKSTVNVRETIIYQEIPKKDTDIYVITQEGDRLDNLANQFYSDPSLWWYIAQANNLFAMNLEPNISLRIPVDLAFTELEQR